MKNMLCITISISVLAVLIDSQFFCDSVGVWYAHIKNITLTFLLIDLMLFKMLVVKKSKRKAKKKGRKGKVFLVKSFMCHLKSHMFGVGWWMVFLTFSNYSTLSRVTACFNFLQRITDFILLLSSFSASWYLLTIALLEMRAPRSPITRY